MIKGTCTSCSGQIEFGESVKKGFCLHCGTQFITEDVVNNFNTINNIKIENAVIQSGPSEQNLLKRAKEFYTKGEFDMASVYADKVLDLNSENKEAQQILDTQFIFLSTLLTIEQVSRIAEINVKQSQLSVWNSDEVNQIFALDNELKALIDCNNMSAIKETLQMIDNIGWKFLVFNQEKDDQIGTKTIAFKFKKGFLCASAFIVINEDEDIRYSIVAGQTLTLKTDKDNYSVLIKTTFGDFRLNCSFSRDSSNIVLSGIPLRVKKHNCKEILIVQCN